MTFQIKSSRTYPGKAPTRKVKHRRYQYYTRLNRFDVPEQADFVVLFSLYAPEDRGSHKTSRFWWQSHVLVFSHAEAAALLANVKTRGGKPDRMFYFGFDSSDQAYLTRGNETGEHVDYSAHCFSVRSAAFVWHSGHARSKFNWGRRPNRAAPRLSCNR